MASEFSDTVKSRYKTSVLIPWGKQASLEPALIKSAKGVYLTLDSGEKILDFKSQNFAANLGHAHEGMLKSIAYASNDINIFASENICPMRLKLGEKLLSLSPSLDMNKIFYTLGGAEANENAIKMARLFTGRHKIITRYRSYHGATLATINFSGDYRRVPFDSSMNGIVRFPDPYPYGSGQIIDTVRLLEEIIEIEGKETIAAILLEGITGANGVFVPDMDYWPRIRKLCDKYGILLIADEVFSGFFRAKKWFAVENFATTPDMITISKGLTAGYAPLGAVLINKAVSQHFEDNTLWCGLTQYGHYISCATALAAIKYYEEDNIQKNVEEREQELKSFLEDLKENNQFIAETRSIGLLAAIDLKDPKTNKPLVPYRAEGDDLAPAIKLQKALKLEGVSALVRFSSIILAPPLIITQSELKEGMDAVKRALNYFLL